MPDMKTLNGYEIVDSQARQDIEELRQQVENFEPSVDVDLSNYYTKEETENTISAMMPTAVSNLENDAGYATEQYVNDQLSSGGEKEIYYLDFSSATTEYQDNTAEMLEFYNVVFNEGKTPALYIKNTQDTDCYQPANYGKSGTQALLIYNNVMASLDTFSRIKTAVDAFFINATKYKLNKQKPKTTLITLDDCPKFGTAMTGDNINLTDYDPELSDYQMSMFCYMDYATGQQTWFTLRLPIANSENIIRTTAPCASDGDGGWGQRIIFDLSDDIKARLLPEVTDADEGKTLKVVNGVWTLV